MNENKKIIKKPLTVALEDAKEELVKSINKVANENGLSFFLLDLIFNDIHQEIKVQKENERLKAREDYEKSRKESDKKWLKKQLMGGGGAV